jgi:hypothetical protein
MTRHLVVVLVRWAPFEVDRCTKGGHGAGTIPFGSGT